MFRWKLSVLLVSVFGGLCLGSVALAGEFPVPTFTDRGQFADAVAYNSVSEEFLVIWTSDGSLGDDDWDFSIQARRFDLAGLPIGEQFQVNAFTNARQSNADVAVDVASGNFVVVWAHRLPATNAFADMRWRLFASDGTPLSGEVQINEGTQDRGIRPSVKPLPSGEFVFTWVALDESGEDFDIFVRRYADDGTSLGGAFQVNQEPLIGFGVPRVATDLSTGQFLVVWSEVREPPVADWQVEARAFTSAGTPLGDTFVVAGMTRGDFRQPDVAFEPQSEAFVVAWTDLSELDGDERGVLMRRVLADGTLLGDVTVVNTTTALDQTGPRMVTQSTGGEFEIVWISETGSGSTLFRENVRARRFTSGGSPLGPDFQVSGLDRNISGGSAMAALSNQQSLGSSSQPFYVWSAWMPCGDSSDWGVSAFYAPGPSDPCELSMDGFESGDFGGWSAVVGQ